MKNIPEIFKSKDIVFHYCKMNTALESILFYNKLRLYPRKNSSDPVEKIKPIISEGGWFNPDDDPQKISDKLGDSRAKIRKLILDKLDSCRQVCFCMNDDADLENQKHLPFEYYGFLKPRMWDQYADNYRGVCLAFSLKKLLKNNNYIHDKIDYIKYSEFYRNNKRIDFNDLMVKGEDLFIKDYDDVLNKMLFRKHFDYQGENEYRFCTFSGNEFEEIDISESLIGIIASENFANEFAKEALDKYAEKLNIELLYIHWEDSSINISTKIQLDKIIQLIESFQK